MARYAAFELPARVTRDIYTRAQCECSIILSVNRRNNYSVDSRIYKRIRNRVFVKIYGKLVTKIRGCTDIFTVCAVRQTVAW